MVNRRHSVARPGVEQHGGGVVVAVGAHRLAEPGIVLDVPGRAGDVPAVRAAPGVSVAARAAGQHGLAAHPPGVDRAERRGGEGGEHARVRGDRLGDALAPGQARADELPGVPLVDLASRPGRRSRGGCRRRRAALPRARRRCRRRGRSRRWPGRWRRCGRAAGSGASTRRSWRAGVPRRGSRPRRWSRCRRRPPQIPSPVKGSGFRAAVAAVIRGGPSVAGRPGG